MPLFRRHEGARIRKASTLRLMLPYLMPGRNEAAVYFEQELDVTSTLRYLERVNAGLERKRVSFFHLVLASCVRAVGMRPDMNRFVVGRRLYQRHHLDFSFAVKKRLADDAPMTTVKVRFEPDDTIDRVIERIDAAIGAGRGRKRTASEQEMSLVQILPRFAIRLVLWGIGVLDYFNLLPRKMIDNDPLYASIFFANLGSVGLDAPFHHLYEYGTVPLFGVIGRIRRIPVVTEDGQIEARDVVRIRWTEDERITDGLYCAGSLDLMRQFLQDPQVLERPPGVAAGAGSDGPAAESISGISSTPPP